MKKAQAAYLILLILWIMITAVVLLFPYGLFLPPGIFFAPPHSDKVAHFFIFVVMAFLFFKVYTQFNVKKNIFLSFVSAVILGIFFEYMQIFVPLRTFSYYDMMVNCFGSMTVFLFEI